MTSLIVAVVFLFIGYLLAYLKFSSIRQKEQEIQKEKELAQQHEVDLKLIAQKQIAEEDAKHKVHQAVLTQRSVLKGKISEQFAPFLKGFPSDLNTSEAHFIGNPVDFIVFKGMNENNITEVVFIEVKSGKHNWLNKNEYSLRKAIENKSVSYVPYHIPDEISEGFNAIKTEQGQPIA
jgi:predicted Holliday junction resolvase-like endonuclease